jgi:hypothetical protein
VRSTSTFALEVPSAAEDGPTDFTTINLTVTKITAVLVGSGSPSVTWTIRWGANRDNPGTEVVTGGTTTTNTTTGDVITLFNNPVIAADSFIWLETTAKSGTVDSMMVALVYA